MLTFAVGTAGCANRPLLYDTVAPVLQEQAAIRQVWPGYWSEEQAFLVYAMEGPTLLYTPAAPPAGYRRLDGSGASDLPAALRNRLYLNEGVPDGLHDLFDTAYPVGDVKATAVSQEGSVAATLTTLFHETFHAWQDEHFTDMSTASFFVDPAYITPALAAQTEVERRLLSETLQEHRPEQARVLAMQYLALRSVRKSELPESVRAIEADLERIEGSAALVGMQAVAAVLHRSPDDVSRNVRQNYLGRPLTQFESTIQDRLFRWRLYGTGAAIGLLLDRFDAGNWRRRLERGATFESLLAETIGFDSVSDPQVLAQRALGRHGFETILRDGDLLWGTPESPSIEDFYATPASIVILLPMEPRREGFSGDFFTLAENVTLLEAQQFAANLSDFSLTVHEHDVLQDMRAVPRLVIALPALPEVPGRPATPGPMTLSDFILEAEGLQIRADRPVEIQIASDSIVVRILPR